MEHQWLISPQEESLTAGLPGTYTSSPPISPGAPLPSNTAVQVAPRDEASLGYQALRRPRRMLALLDGLAVACALLALLGMSHLRPMASPAAARTADVGVALVLLLDPGPGLSQRPVHEQQAFVSVHRRGEARHPSAHRRVPSSALLAFADQGVLLWILGVLPAPGGHEPRRLLSSSAPWRA